ncbi:hypothetical protein BN3456_01877 [Clostridium sp. C105KSO13]|nr:hypothetical protein BN3456_01877 [Clostridium sp. C105KSO13]
MEPKGNRRKSSQVKGLKFDETLESCLFDTEEAIPVEGRIFQVIRQRRICIKVCLCLFFRHVYKKD